jgi:RNA polymerase sigma-70 factor (ECF subfamily)
MKKKRNSEIPDNKHLEQRLNLFQYLFTTYYQSLMAYAYKITNDHQEAEDIVQDVFMSFWVNKDTFDFSKPIKPYLFKAVYNRSVNFLKAKKESIEITECETDEMLHRKIIGSYQEDSLLLKEMTEEINHFIATLPAQCRNVFKLSRISGLKNKEIAKAMDISEKTVESHIGKALKDLRIYLKKKGFMPLFIFCLCNIF